MATAIIMPRQGQSVESCIITEWNKNVGDKINIGDVLFTYETDKASFEEESTIEGTLLARFFDVGDDVPCLLNVAVIGNEGESFEEFRPSESSDEATIESAPDPATLKEVIKTADDKSDALTVTNSQNGELFASPRAKAAADRMGVDISMAKSTGPKGRIIERDVLAIDRFAIPGTVDLPSVGAIGVIGGASNFNQYEDVPLTRVRKTIAKNMLNSLQTSAQLTHHITFNASQVLDYRANLKSNSEKLGLPNITLGDMVLYAVSRTLLNHSAMNAHYLEDEGVMREFNSVNLGVAVDTPRGLLVPTIFGANTKTLAEISTELKQIALEARDGSISPDLLSGASFTVSNLGNLGTEMFTPVINPPQTGILGVCTITQRAKETSDGTLEFYPAMGLSLTYDHRAIDGYPAGVFLADLVNNLENFNLLLAK